MTSDNLQQKKIAESFKVVLESGKFWYKVGENNVLHRISEPAVIKHTPDGMVNIYYLNGKRHCENGPAYRVLGNSMYDEWYFHGKRFYPQDKSDFKKMTKLSGFK